MRRKKSALGAIGNQAGKVVDKASALVGQAAKSKAVRVAAGSALALAANALVSDRRKHKAAAAATPVRRRATTKARKKAAPKRRRRAKRKAG